MGLFNRLKTWAFEEVEKSADLNAEFDNVINHLLAQYIAGSGSTLSAFQTTLNPGGLGTEVLTQNSAQDIQELRYTIARILGGGLLWYQQPPVSLTDLSTILTSALSVPPNRIVSGRVRTTSNQPIFLQADGTLSKVRVKAGGGNPSLEVFIESTQYTFSADILSNVLTTAPATNNTCLANDASLNSATGYYAGEPDAPNPTLIIDTVGSAISALVGQFAAFSCLGEYFLGYVKSATTITNCKRGFFFDNTDTPVVRAAILDNTVITLMKLAWIFVNSSGALSASYNTPTWSVSAPSSPSIQDYWFDLVNQKWMVYNGSSFVDAASILIGLAIQDTTKCVASRSFDFYASYAVLNQVELQQNSVTQIASAQPGQMVSVAGKLINYGDSFLTWNTPTDLAPGLSAAAATYYLYVTDTGKTYLDTEKPYDRTADLLGYYHPYNPWRSVGTVTTSGANVFVATSLDGVYGSHLTFVKYTTPGTYTFLTPGHAKALRFIGCGGGGGGGLANSGATGNTGGNTTINTTLLVGNGGQGGASTGGNVGTGGTASLGTGPVGYAVSGGSGGNRGSAGASGDLPGGVGGQNPFGGGGGSSAGAANTGGGGYGQDAGTGQPTSSGGGAGGYFNAMVYGPASSYTIVVGAAGVGGATPSRDGGSGVVYVEIYY